MSAPSASDAPDRRLAAYRPDLADARLKGRVAAERFVEGAPMRVAAALAPFRSRPDAAASVTATKLMGEPLRVFERAEGWAWVQSEHDGYVGYTPDSLLAEGWLDAGAAVVAMPRTHFYPAPDLKRPPVGWAPMEARIALADARGEKPGSDENGFKATADGAWVYAKHLRPADMPAGDWISIAERFLGAPYLWGGDSIEGIDCSGLVRIALRAAGRACPRDSDMQEQGLGAPLAENAPLQRGDLVFWKGHVGVMQDAERLLHANAWSMSVLSEPLAGAIARIEASGAGAPTARRRLEG